MNAAEWALEQLERRAKDYAATHRVSNGEGWDRVARTSDGRVLLRVALDRTAKRTDLDAYLAHVLGKNEFDRWAALKRLST